MMQNPKAEISLEAIHEPRLSQAELEELVCIERACYKPPTCYSRRTIQRFLELRGSLLTRARLKDGVLAGFQIGNLAHSQLVTLDVLPQHQRQGIGSAILRCTLCEFRKHKSTAVQCEISVENEPSIDLHLKFGFMPFGTIPHYYESGEDAIVMILPLMNPDME